MQRLRSGLFAFSYFLSGIIWGALSLLIRPLPKLIRHNIIVMWTRFSIRSLGVICGVTYKTKGLEIIEALDEPVVVMSKHQSTWETLYLQHAFSPASTILKKSLLKIPFFGWGLASLHPIAIDRNDPIQALKQVKSEGVARLKQGFHLILFPEGTRVKPGEKRKYARSGVDIALKAGVKIVPVAHNAGEFWPIDSKVKIPGVISVEIGQPIDPSGRSSKEVIAEIEEWIESTIEGFER